MGSAQAFLLIFLLFGVAIIAILIYLLRQLNELKNKPQDNQQEVLMTWLKEMRVSVDNSAGTMERQLQQQRETMDKQTKMIWERLDNATKVIGNVQQHLGGLQEFSKDMKDLSNVLKSPKLRGGLGEQLLYEILAEFLPKDLYRTQYKFRNGGVCDAVIKTDKGLIPIDSKFPMENYKEMYSAKNEEERIRAKKAFAKDVKNRIDEISSKYILPEEGTTEQAVMYIPSESVYYEIIVGLSELEEYARRKHVVMASPNTLSTLLKIVLVAYQQHELEKNAGEILKALSGIKHEAARFDEDLSVLDGHIGRTAKSMDNVKVKFGKLSGKISAVESLGESGSVAELADGIIDSTIEEEIS